MVLSGELFECFFLFGKVAIAEIRVPVFLSGLSEGGQHGIGSDDTFLNQSVGLLYALVKLFLHLFYVRICWFLCFYVLLL